MESDTYAGVLMTAGEASFRRLLSSIQRVPTSMLAEIVAQDLYEIAYQIREKEHEFDSALVTSAEPYPYIVGFERYMKLYIDANIKNTGLTIHDFLSLTADEMQVVIKLANPTDKPPQQFKST